jgi:hypothetical protein
MTFQEFLQFKTAQAIVEHIETLSDAEAREVIDQLDESTIELIEAVLDEKLQSPYISSLKGTMYGGVNRNFLNQINRVRAEQGKKPLDIKTARIVQSMKRPTLNRKDKLAAERRERTGTTAPAHIQQQRSRNSPIDDGPQPF